METNIIERIKNDFADLDLNSGEALDHLLAIVPKGVELAPLKQWATTKKRVAASKWNAKVRDVNHERTMSDLPSMEGKSMTEAFIRELWETYAVAVKYTGELDATVDGDRRERSVGDLGNHMMTEADRREYPSLPRNLAVYFRDKAISRVLSQCVVEKRQERFDTVANTVFAKPVGTVEMERVMGAVADDRKQSLRYTIATVRAFVWQVKRKLRGLPVTDHFMPVFVGRQRGGKSTFIRKLLAPLEELRYDANWKQLTDGSQKSLWTFPVLFLDEMEAADRASVESIKGAITKDVHTARELYSMESSVTTCRHTCIGASNKAVGDMVKDATGLRRFAQIVCLDRMDWDVVNEFDALDLWRSVDHLGPNPMAEVRVEWEAIMEVERDRCSVELFCDDVGLGLVAVAPGKPYTATELRDAYADWCSRNGHQPLATRTFGRRLTQLADGATYPFADRMLDGYKLRVPLPFRCPG